MTNIKEPFPRDQRFLVTINGTQFVTQYKYLKHSTGYFKKALDHLLVLRQVSDSRMTVGLFGDVEIVLEIIPDNATKEKFFDNAPTLDPDFFGKKRRQRFLFTFHNSQILLQYRFLVYSTGVVRKAIEAFLEWKIYTVDQPTTMRGVFDFVEVEVEMVTSDEFKAKLPLVDMLNDGTIVRI